MTTAHAVAAARLQIVVLAKAPAPGHVKTRLSPTYSPEAAARLANAALLDTLDAMCDAPAGGRFLALDGDFVGPLPTDVEVLHQRGDGLAERIDGAKAFFTTVIKRGEETVAEVTSSWCCLDAVSKRPARLARDIADRFLPRD